MFLSFLVKPKVKKICGKLFNLNSLRTFRFQLVRGTAEGDRRTEYFTPFPSSSCYLDYQEADLKFYMTFNKEVNVLQPCPYHTNCDLCDSRRTL